MKDLILNGLTADHIDKEYNIHKDIVSEFLQLKQRAHKDGIDLCIASGFRDFSRQNLIWSEKCQGLRDVYDKDSNLIDITTLPAKELVFAILRWSALPGFSRHHWGTEIDVYDKNALNEGESFELVPAEYEKNGPFEKLGRWLADHDLLGFQRPYFRARNKVASEPWHLSYTPLAMKFEIQWSAEHLKEFMRQKQIKHSNIIIEHAEEIFKSYIGF